MKEVTKVSPAKAYTLIELVCTLAIIGLMAALLMPAVSQAYARARRAYCINSLRQMGIAFHGFAHGHEDKFPIQVSTNNGGSREWLQTAQALQDEFYFSYRHFLPLAGELRSPRILTCPSDLRQPATHFDHFKNENLSYFVAANPELGKSDSIVAGDRNLNPTFGSMARVGGVLYLKWTRELHEFKGNVLFADGHVEQLKDILRLTNSTKVDQLVMPSVPPLTTPTPTATSVPLANSAGQGRAGSGSNAGTSLVLLTNLMAVSNPVLTTTANAPKSGRQPAVATGASGSAAAAGDNRTVAAADAAEVDQPARIEQPLPAPILSPAATVIEDTPPASPSESATTVGRKIFTGTVSAISQVPWYLILLLLLAMVEVRRRIRNRQRKLARARFVVPNQ